MEIAKVTAKKDSDKAVSIAMEIEDEDKKKRALEYITEEVGDIKGESFVNKMIEQIGNYIDTDIDKIIEDISNIDEVDEKITELTRATLIIVNLPLIKVYINAKQENNIMEFIDIMETQNTDKISEYIQKINS